MVGRARYYNDKVIFEFQLEEYTTVFQVEKKHEIANRRKVSRAERRISKKS